MGLRALLGRRVQRATSFLRLMYYPPPSFPSGSISYHILTVRSCTQLQVWKNLDSCEHGIKRGNGQRKVRNGPVCVNPYCYKPADAYAILTPLASTLTTLGLTNDKVISKTLEHMGWSGTGFSPPATADETFGSKGETCSLVVHVY